MDIINNSGPEYNRLLHEQKERLKELACINQTTAILKESKPVEESLQQIVLLLPPAWQYPDHTVARIMYMGKRFDTFDFRETKWHMAQDFTTIDGEIVSIEVFYTSEFRKEFEGPFLKEERDLIQNIGSLITGYINSYKARDLIMLSQTSGQELDYARDLSGRKLLQKFLNRHNAERDVFHDLMPFKVKEILLIANLYDAYSIESEGRFADHILGEYYQMNLTSIPRVTGVSSEDDAFSRLRTRYYDMIIIMVGVDKQTPVSLCRRIKEKYPYIPAFLLLGSATDVPFVKKQKALGIPFDNYFVWKGDSKVLFAMVKLLEDRVNIDNDTRKGLTRLILVVEDSAEYYSTYLPMIYNLVMEQTRNLIDDESSDGLFKILKLRARPKIMLACDYEDSMASYTKYRDSLLCVISDVRFPVNGEMSETAGYDFLKHVKEELPGLPVVLQSSDPDNAKYAYSLKATFINKNSHSLLQDLKSFINYYLGFGHFIYRDNKGRQIAVAKSMKEFESYLQTVPDDSLVYHAQRNHFSQWLMARGEVKIARDINPLKVSDFSTISELREYLIGIIWQRRREMNAGRIVNFEESAVLDETNVVSLIGGSMGGKGRCLAFVNALIYSFELGRLLPGINIKTPVTAIIGTDEFDLFMERNHLWEKVKGESDFLELQKHFLKGSLSFTLEKKLRVLLRLVKKPLAVRSSSLYEDSMSQPFSGIFRTYLLPNNNDDPDIRLKQLTEAIKLVFSSIYSDSSRTYFNAINYKIEQEKMAIVIQEVVGNRFDDAFYPHISGTAQSFNYYPVAHMVPEDGYAVIAVGLGQYVMEGERAFRFSPAYPSIDIISQKDLYKNSQVHFYAVDMSKKVLNLLEGEYAGLVSLDVTTAEKHGTIKHSASVMNIDNDTITPGLDSPGPRVINFADILKYEYVPLASTLKTVLDVVTEAFGTPVEIEFAVDLNKDQSGNTSFYLLQIKPLVGSYAGYSINPDTIKEDELVIMSKKSMGNGLVDHIVDFIYIEPEKFDNTLTTEMAAEIDRINRKMIEENRQYILMGPGRWGTRDKFIGIPVEWPQISNAKVIVEVSLPGFHVDASLGSHFFHNVTSMNVGYFSINEETYGGVVKWDMLGKQKVINRGKYFNHVRFDSPLTIRMDGRKGMAVISINQ
ncbi:MAG TPA: pyruvate, phosphate dikinase [Bacteroidales bacterium]|nr:pyruvate, phosphate dikinase [Bacteroidales bacterium]HBQ83093.1 pyruvate, phosphate dikinase [Bacteroidales bacterium]HCU20949.1 pyruvate, phosphate dikinase [Bacteroidales bacterium]